MQKACGKIGLHLDIVGPAVNRTIDDFAACLRDYDLVFGSGRVPTEALAAGCSVIVMDGRGYAGLVTAQNVADWWRRNFGLQILTGALDPAIIARDIARYDAHDTAKAAQYIRAHASLDIYMENLIAVYERAIADFAANPVPVEATLKAIVPALLGPLYQQTLLLNERSTTKQSLGAHKPDIKEHTLIETLDRMHQHNAPDTHIIGGALSDLARLLKQAAHRLRRRQA